MAKHLFKKGQSGNPHGRPPSAKHMEDFKVACGRMLPQAMKEMERLLKSTKTNPAVKVRITEMMADRVYGRPAQAVTGAGGGPILISFADVLASIDGSKTEPLEAAG